MVEEIQGQSSVFLDHWTNDLGQVLPDPRHVNRRVLGTREHLFHPDNVAAVASISVPYHITAV